MDWLCECQISYMIGSEVKQFECGKVNCFSMYIEGAVNVDKWDLIRSLCHKNFIN